MRREDLRMRSFTIAEAAEATGLTQKALRKRVEQGHVRAVLREGKDPRIPESELKRAGLLPERDPPGVANGSGRAPESEIVRELVAVIERQAAELAALRSRRVG
jgi:excisionase family DNA binding protein